MQSPIQDLAALTPKRHRIFNDGGGGHELAQTSARNTHSPGERLGHPGGGEENGYIFVEGSRRVKKRSSARLPLPG